MLSDSQIADALNRGELVVDGDLSKISSCAYEFRPGVIIKTGKLEPQERIAADWSGETTAIDSYEIPPGELVWVRTAETVVMPNDICAFWWQTNTLSRKGLMLVNMSMVEPGYKGPLACLFVNFGHSPVEIGPESVVAKLVFMKMDGQVEKPYEVEIDRKEYDISLIRAAKLAPPKFLDVDRFSRATFLEQVQSEVESAHEEVQIEIKRAQDEIRKVTAAETSSAKESLEDAQTDLQDTLQADTQTQLKKVLAGTAIGFIVVVAAMTFVPWLQSLVQPSLSSEIRKEINTVLNQRLSVPPTEEIAILRERIRELEAQIDERDETDPTQGQPSP